LSKTGGLPAEFASKEGSSCSPVTEDSGAEPEFASEAGNCDSQALVRKVGPPEFASEEDNPHIGAHANGVDRPKCVPKDSNSYNEALVGSATRPSEYQSLDHNSRVPSDQTTVRLDRFDTFWFAGKKIMKCCGVLCYAIDPATRHAYFLLGKETYDGLWSDFSGSPKSDESFEDAACREFMEESMGLILPETTLREDLLGAARKFTLVLRHENRLTYVKQIPFRPELPQLFSDFRQDILAVATELSKCAEYLEKSEIAWFSINKLWTLIRHDRIAHVSSLRLRKHFVNTLANILDFFMGKKT
jgi:8-oxo-dGTP pyrophosphatase MutT (NUDIX family)